MNNDLLSIRNCQYFNNQLLINPEKTKLMILVFGSRQMTAKINDFRRLSFREGTQARKAAKDLGVTLDSNLTLMSMLFLLYPRVCHD